MARYVLDRFEGEWALMESENGSILRILRSVLPDAHEGDVLEESGGLWQVDTERTESLREAVRRRLSKLKRK